MCNCFFAGKPAAVVGHSSFCVCVWGGLYRERFAVITPFWYSCYIWCEVCIVVTELASVILVF